MSRTFNRSRFGAALAAHRTALGLNQREAAEASGVSQALLSDVERGVRAPLHETVGKLCAWLERDMADFWDDVPDVTPVLID